MRWKHFGSLIICIILALFLVTIGSIKGLIILHAYALAVISVGLGVNSLAIALHTDRRMNKIDTTLARIEGIQEQIKKAQEEQLSSPKPLVATLQGLSQYYLDYIAKQKREDEQNEEK